MKFIIVSAVYNMSEHLKANIDMLKQQDYGNFEVYFGDDMSTDDSCEVIEANINDDARFHLIKHQEKLFSMGNIDKTIELAKPNKEDIIVLIDGDDTLADTTVLSYLKEIYESQKCLMTFGSFSSSGKKDTTCSGYPYLIRKFNLYRFVKWRASHLKTFKYKLWEKVNKQDLTITKQEFQTVLNKTLLTGKITSWNKLRKVNYEDLVTTNQLYARRCSDKLLTSPMLELAGERAVYIPKILYYYQPQGAHDFGNSNSKWAQRFIRAAVFLKPRYQKINIGE